MVPQNYVTMSSEEDVKSMEKLLDMLDDNDDVPRTCGITGSRTKLHKKAVSSSG